MNYWITIHYPPHVIDFDGPFYCGVYLQEGQSHVAKDMQVGDLVFKYESQSGPSRNIVLPSGQTTTQKCQPGKMGVVALMEVVGFNDDPQPAPTKYADGSQKLWRHHAHAISKDTDGFLSLADLNPLLGFKPKNNMRGFGDSHSGLKRIDMETFARIYTAFKNRKTA